MIPAVQSILEGSAAVTAIVGARIDRGVSPQDITQPRITWHLVTNVPQNSLACIPGMDNTRVQVDCWAQSQVTARMLAQAARDAIERETPVVFGPVEMFEQDAGVYRWTFDASFWNKRS